MCHFRIIDLTDFTKCKKVGKVKLLTSSIFYMREIIPISIFFSDKF